jgi:MazG family protein
MSDAALEFSRLLEIMDRLRGEKGCSWDRKQTLKSLRKYFLEEVYELLEAMDKEDWPSLQEELGDLLFHVVFQVRIAAEQRVFTMAEVIRGINEKLVRRHPHVFQQQGGMTPEEVAEQWERIKLREGRKDKSLLSGVPRSLCSLARSQRVQEKAAAVGFEWKSVTGALDKLEEEFREFREQVEAGNGPGMEVELGDLLFSVVNVARYLDLSSEDALRHTVDKFMRRFRYIEQRLDDAGRELGKASLEEMDRYWNEAKEDE